MTLLRSLAVTVIFLCNLSAQIDLEFEIRVKLSFPDSTEAPTTRFRQRILLQNQITRLENAGFFLQVNSKSSMATLGNPREKSFLQIPVKTFQELLGNPFREQQADEVQVRRDEATKADPYTWLERQTIGRVCTLTSPSIAGGPSATKLRVTVYSVPLSKIFKSDVSTDNRKQIAQATLNQINGAGSAILRECSTEDELPVRFLYRSEMDTSQKNQLKAEIDFEIMSLTEAPIPDARFEVPNGWTKAPESDAQAFMRAYSSAHLPSEPYSATNFNRPRSRQQLLADLDLLKKHVEDEKWAEANALEGQISYQLYLKAEEAKGSPQKQIEKFEAKLQNQSPSPYEALEAARLAFEASDPIKIRKYSQLSLDLAAKQSTMDESHLVHEAHTFLGLMDLFDSNRQSAASHLTASGNVKGGPTTKTFGPRMELAKLLLEAGEKDLVLSYLENCKKIWISNQGLPSLERWIADIKAGLRPNFGIQASVYKLPKR